MSTLKIVGLFALFCVAVGYLWLVGEAFAHINVWLAFGLILLGILILIIIFKKLPKKLRQLGQDFLTDIQILHDIQKYWNSEGLSKVGEEYYKDIKEKYEL